jgi:DNA-binding NarL/FixJ family response regulator
VRCLRLLAAGRRPLPIEAVRRAALPGGPLPFPLIEEAVRSGLARRDGDGRLGLIHDRYAEAIEALSLPTERQPVHAALAAALDGRPAEQAWHWEAAMRFGAARDAHVAAGREARAIDPGATALSHFVRGLELLDARDPGAAEPRIDQAELLVEASEAAFAADQPRRAAGLIGQAIGASTFHDVSGSAVDEPAPPQRRQVAVAVLHRQLGRYLAAAGDGPGSIRALEAAAEAAPPEAARERGRILGLLAQQLMLDGRFADSADVAERARVAVRDQPDASAELSHATCTLAVDRGYLGDVDAGLVLLAEAEALASRAGRLDDLMRACANRTHLLEMDARLEAALSAVQDGIAACRRYGVEAAYGAFLRGNAADILFRLGRWSEAEAECRAALEWSTSRLAWSPLLALAGILVESQADEEARRTVGQILLQLEAVPEGQWTAALQRAAVSFALWRNDLADALRSAREGWQRVLETHEPRQVALAASTTLEACAAVSDAARSRREVAAVVAAGQLGSSVLAAAARTVGGVVGPPGAAREARLHLETARAHGGRLRGRYDPAAWAHLAVEWAELGMPYLTAKCRWWQAAALLQARASRTEARDALLEAWSLAHTLSARPLLTELERLAGRARIALPSATSNRAAGAATQTAGVDDRSTQPTEPAHAGGPGRRPELVRQPEPAGLVQLIRANAARPLGRAGAGSAQRRRVDRGEALAGLTDRLLRSDVPVRDPFNLSPREFEVLSIIVEGRTNREIAERLFISERTVGVHVRNILAKLDVSGRIEAANVAIRLGLVPVPSTVRLLPSA